MLQCLHHLLHKFLNCHICSSIFHILPFLVHYMCNNALNNFMACIVCHKTTYTSECRADGVEDQYILRAQCSTIMFCNSRGTPQCNLHDRQCKHRPHQDPSWKAVTRTYHNCTLHLTLLQIRPTSFRNCTSTSLLLNRKMRDILQM